jgi:hypothetical protein
MKNGFSSIIHCILVGVIVTNGFSAETKTDQFSLRIENDQPEGKIITLIPKNEELKKDPKGGPYMMTVHIASTLPLLRHGLFLKSKRAEIPLDTNSPPPLSFSVFVADFEVVVVEVSSIKHWSEWKKTYYFRVSDSELFQVDAEKLGLPTDKSRAEQ